jgi:hypothetical protein
MKAKVYILFLFLFSLQINAQELNCTVTVNATTNTNSTAVSPKLFKTLEKTIQDFMNLRKWTSENYNLNQKINCNLIINITEIPRQDVYKADITIQSERPIFNSNYSTQILRHKEAGVPFVYIENDPIEYSDNVFNNSLASTLAFFSYFIIALDNESFSYKTGQPILEKAENVCNIVPFGANAGGESLNGWRQQEAQSISGAKTKIGMVLTMLNSRGDKFRKAFYDYHLNGLDLMADSAKTAKSNIVKALDEMAQYQQSNNTYLPSMFMLAKQDEVINMFKSEPADTRKKVGEYMIKIEPSLSSVVQKNLMK